MKKELMIKMFPETDLMICYTATRANQSICNDIFSQGQSQSQNTSLSLTFCNHHKIYLSSKISKLITKPST